MLRRPRSVHRLPAPLTAAARLGLGLGLGLVTTATGCSGDAEAAAAAEIAEASAAASALATALDPARYDPRESLAPMIKAVGPAVVAVDARGSGGGGDQGQGGQGGQGRWFGGGNEQTIRGMGSGFVVEADGLVVTNHHVIDGARTIEVRLSDGRKFPARVVGSDPATDLALLRLHEANDLPVVTLGSSATLEVGDWVVAMGNPMGLDHSATVGIVSGKGRGSLGLYRDSYIDFLQTDADIAPGSSGGPLFNLRGEVIGINTAVGADLRPGFAIPIDQAKRIVEQLRDRGEVVRGWLGAGNQPGARGATIGSVYEGTPAERAGLRPGDVIETLDGESVPDFESLRARVGSKSPGDEVELRVRRGDDMIELRATLGAKPEASSLEALRPSRGAPHDDDERWYSSPFGSLPFGRHAPSPSPSPSPEDARLGASVRSSDAGLEVVEVHEGSLAQQLGLRPGDRLRELDGQVLERPSDVTSALARAGSHIEARFEREGAVHVVTLDR
ncbi:S1C family serine protease [Paraliomyxa miuraensis]|uniref:S1C family serine protease n=1 Tax=Paraliomyxa miuraensis TaxID=376150 RepID=UPI002257D393|nr:trypsin-like peptidase domain-containing protein [Paraliomyxa miuraensis]MCX4246274.1 trypsin-like peptidase domain-containing protein [Paraliomyxa miuraensis]